MSRNFGHMGLTLMCMLVGRLQGNSVVDHRRDVPVDFDSYSGYTAHRFLIMYAFAEFSTFFKSPIGLLTLTLSSSKMIARPI